MAEAPPGLIFSVPFINQVWSMDLMHDQPSDGRSFRLCNVIDDSRTCAACNLLGPVGTSCGRAHKIIWNLPPAFGAAPVPVCR